MGNNSLLLTSLKLLSPLWVPGASKRFLAPCHGNFSAVPNPVSAFLLKMYKSVILRFSCFQNMLGNLLGIKKKVLTECRPKEVSPP